LHWADVVALRLLERGLRHRVASGTSISGQIHLGNAGDVIYADGIARAVRGKGSDAEVLWIADDVDPLRSVPEQLPASFAEHLGKPVSSLPDPDACHASLPDHFIEPFLASLKEVGVAPVEKRGSKMYAAGEYDAAIRVAFERAEEIRQILVRVAKSKKPAGWLPFDPVCEACGRIATTDATGLEGDKVLYRCGGGVAGKKEMEGCGNEGATSIRHGKLTWRVEWAARWQILGVTCEPFGKEHSAAGGSYDTSKVICAEVFGYPPPLPVLYEHILVAGRKMSKSKGNVIPPSALLEVLPPEAVRYFYFRVDPNKHQDFDPSQKLLPLVEEYERIQAIAAGRLAPSPREDAADIRRTEELSRVDADGAAPVDSVPFNHLVTLAQLSSDTAEVLRLLKRSGYEVEEGTPEALRLGRRASLARRFCERWLGESDRIQVVLELARVPFDKIGEGERAFLRLLSRELDGGSWTPAAIHDTVFKAAGASGLSPKDAFRAVYLAVLGREKGPRAGYFLSSLEPAFVVSRLREAGAPK